MASIRMPHYLESLGQTGALETLPHPLDAHQGRWLSGLRVEP